MANWEKLNKEFDDALDSMTSEDWELLASKSIKQTTRTMTPQEKAREIFDKYWLFFVEDTDAMGIHKLAKQCAIIAVKEIMKLLPLSNRDFWLQVIHEINNL
jgi:hypothetical protein